MDRFAKTVTLDPINQLVSTLHFALDFMLQHFDWQSFVEIIFCKKNWYQHNDSHNQALWCCRGGEVLLWGRDEMRKVSKIIISGKWKFFFTDIFKRTFSGACILCLLLLCFDFDSLRDPRHLASVQLVVNSSSFTLDLHFHANTTALSAKISFHLHKTFTFLELSLF